MRHTQRQGFTLVELLVVITMMAIIMGMGIVIFTGVFKGTALSTGGRQVAATLNLSRQYAITQRLPVRVVFDLNNHRYYTTVLSNLPSGPVWCELGGREVLPTGVVFTNTAGGVANAHFSMGGSVPTNRWIEFKPTGAASASYGVMLFDGRPGPGWTNNYSNVKVSSLMGSVKIQRP